MSSLRKPSTPEPAVEPIALSLPGPQTEPDWGDDGMGESRMWVPGDLDEEAGR
ncbi:hypothetical protein OG756_31880 [Streptomyces sp. NBC_01310]|uniref:hypothetical protein n=1 Tax=Streptomyces sp. NBC_01310 TaxID=2903820 RepID=UPI0035B687E4|nr:hypothetical protein OG756_31880 [Streptomyces sp. NBC_01310]